jgi:hypothetical protein
MIGVTVRHEHARKACAGLVKMAIDRREMPRLANPGIDERSLPVWSDEQVGVVARPGHWTRVVRGELDGVERHGDGLESTRGINNRTEARNDVSCDDPADETVAAPIDVEAPSGRH